MSEHGTTRHYKLGCRCELCRAAKKADHHRYYLQRKKREAEGLPPGRGGRPQIPLSEREHGSYVTYNKGCRCGACTSANSQYGRQQKRKRLRESESPEISHLRQLAESLGYEIHRQRSKEVR